MNAKRSHTPTPPPHNPHNNPPKNENRYQTWGQDDASFWRTARLMWRDGGLRPFLKGTSPTILRDLTFGGVYSLLRNGLLRALREVQGENAPKVAAASSSSGSRKGGGGMAAPAVGMEAFVLNIVAAGIATTVCVWREECMCVNDFGLAGGPNTVKRTYRHTQTPYKRQH